MSRVNVDKNKNRYKNVFKPLDDSNSWRYPDDSNNEAIRCLWGIDWTENWKESAHFEAVWRRYHLKSTLPPKEKISKRITDGRVGLAIKAMAQESPKIAIRDYPARLQEVLGSDTAIPQKSTIMNFLQERDLVLKKLQKKPLISVRNLAKRVVFARMGMDFIATLKWRVIWSDECTVRKYPKDKEIFVRCHSSHSRENLPSNLQVHSGGFSVMFWGCMSFYGLGPLVPLGDNLNQHSYKLLLEKHFLPYLNAFRDQCGHEMLFMQDNAPCHKTRLIDAFFDDNCISTVIWPPQSPDMNPIENLWSILKQKRTKKFGTPKSKRDLISQVLEIWNEIDISICQNLT